MSRILDTLEQEIQKIDSLECVEDIDIDYDCLHEGVVDVHIVLKEDWAEKICEEEYE